MLQMIRRINKQLLAEKNLLMTGIALLFLSVFAMVAIQLIGATSNTCFMDAFPGVSYNLPLSIYPPAMFIIIVITKDELRTERVIRQTNLETLWFYLVIKTGFASLILTAGTFLATCIAGLFLADSFCNWAEPDSLCAWLTHQTIENVNYGAVMTVYFFCILLGIWVTGLIPVLMYWLCNSYVAGVILSLMVCLGGNGANPATAYNANRGVFYTTISAGIDTRYQFWYPLFIILILTVFGCSRGKRDFLSKAR